MWQLQLSCILHWKRLPAADEGTPAPLWDTISVSLLEQGAKFRAAYYKARAKQCFEVYEYFCREMCLVGGLVSSKTPGKSFIEGKLPTRTFLFYSTDSTS